MSTVFMQLAAITVGVLCLASLVGGTGDGMSIVVSLVGYDGVLSAICALRAATMKPFCWGSLPRGIPTPSVALWKMTAGGEFFCGLEYETHNPICWGGNPKVTSIPSAFLMTSYSSMNAGNWHVCAVRDNTSLNPGQVDCWGHNNNGQLSSPRMAMISVIGGFTYACGLTLAQRNVVCWGLLGKKVMLSPPSNIQFRAIFGGPLNVCGVTLDNRTQCWSGEKSYPITIPYSDLEFSSIDAIFFEACGIVKDTHKALCWSLTSTGSETMYVPYPLSSLSASSIFPMSDHGVTSFYGYMCGVREDVKIGNVYCVGSYPNPFASTLSSFPAAQGLCMAQCPEDQYPVLIDGQCPNPQHKVCLHCSGTCPSSAAIQNSSSNGSVPTNNALLPSSNSSNSSLPSHTRNTPSSMELKIIVSICAVVAACLAILFVVIIVLLIRRRQCCIPPLPEGRMINLSRQEVQAATRNYQTLLGEGGFARVYKGVYRGWPVAIKIPLQNTSGDFNVELDTITKLNHSSLLKLIGYCQESKALVFPYMAKGSLRQALINKKYRKKLGGIELRFRIALQVAQGLQYMHQSDVIHRDVKTANILLDRKWNAYLADFGVSHSAPIGNQTHCETRVIGSTDYLDPDYRKSGQLTKKSDVYSFGVVLLELVSGSAPTDLASRARALDAQGRISELLPQNSHPDERDCRLSAHRIALDCVKEFRVRRPSMSDVATRLGYVYDQLCMTKNFEGVECLKFDCLG